MMTREQEAGTLYHMGRDAVMRGGNFLNMIPSHIHLVVNGTEEFDGPLWMDRELEPDKRKIHLDSFEDYLLKPAREGLGISSLYFLHTILIGFRSLGPLRFR